MNNKKTMTQAEWVKLYEQQIEYEQMQYDIANEHPTDTEQFRRAQENVRHRIVCLKSKLESIRDKGQFKSLVFCPFCTHPAEWVSHAEIYNGKVYNEKAHMIWLCRPCDAYVGCHQNTKKPLGQMANAHMRKARKLTKELFIEKCLMGNWNCHKELKNAAYAMLADRMGITTAQCHFGDFTVEQCREAYRILQKI